MFFTLFDSALLILLQFMQRAILWLPVRFSESALTALLRVVIFFAPKYRQTAHKNLELAFPQISLDSRNLIYQKSLRSFARVLVDFLRLPALDVPWLDRHVAVIGDLRVDQAYDAASRKVGTLYATGHLGSFEVLAHYCAVHGMPLSFVARSLPFPRVNRWVQSGRELFGNRMIERTGAMRSVLSALENGRSVGILFDQNVTRKHAVFVPWFGRLAATTKAVALAAMKTGCPVVVVSIKSCPDDRYQILTDELDLSPIVNSELLSNDEKIQQITETVSDSFVRMIKDYPEGWFWLHKRWKTAPEGVPEDFY